MVTTSDGRIERADTKEELVHVLAGIRHAVVYGLIADKEVERSSGISDTIDGAHYGFEMPDGPPATVDLSMLAALLRSPHQAAILRGSFAHLLFGAFVRTSYEVVFHYCKQTGQVSRFYAAPFVQFARVVRNMLSHFDGAELTQWPKDLKKGGITSVTWNGRTISETDIGKTLILTPGEMYRLHIDIATFVAEELER
jgi:hypothetical protein